MTDKTTAVEQPRSQRRSQYKVRDVVYALLLLPQDADVWEYADPGGECPLQSLPRLVKVAWVSDATPEYPNDGYWDTLRSEPTEKHTNTQTVVMI